MQKAGESYLGDTFLTKLITRNAELERKGKEIFMYLRTGIVPAGCHVTGRAGGIFHCAWFSSSNTVPYARRLCVSVGESAGGS